jgi:hypothetical protein
MRTLMGKNVAFPPLVLPLSFNLEVDTIVPHMPICSEWGIDPTRDRSEHRHQGGAVGTSSAGSSRASDSGSGGHRASSSGAGGGANPAGHTTPMRRPQRPSPAVVDVKGKCPLVPTTPRLTSSDDEDFEDTISLVARARRVGTPLRPVPPMAWNGRIRSTSSADVLWRGIYGVQ